MAPGESVTQWIDHLIKGGDREAVQRLFERYYERLVREARRWLKRAPTAPVADEDDIAQVAFASFCRRAAEGAAIEETTLDDLLATVPEEDRPQFDKLAAAIKQLSGVKVYKVGDDPEKQVYVVGKTSDGRWAGLKTTVVET